VISSSLKNPKQSILNKELENTVREMLVMGENRCESLSLNTAIVSTGYRDRYDLYLNYFRSKTINKLLDATYEYYKSRKTAQVQSD